MKKQAAQATPNHLLRRARLERGWTQKMVAERIGAPNDVIVTRWERGTAFPSAHYVEQLCQLFGQQASELGLLKELPPMIIPPPLARHLPRSAGATPPQTLSPQQHVPLLSALPLIGREAPMHTLKALYGNIQRGQMQVVLLQGEAGIGKTHLASTFLNWAAAQGATLLQGRAFNMGGPVPYQPLVHALSRHFEEEPGSEAVLSAPYLSELSRILPELRERYPFLSSVTDDNMTARIRLFEAVTHLGQAFCEQAPVVLFLDDLQWADTASLAVVHYAGQRWSEHGLPLLLLLSMRSEDLTTTSSLTRWISDLHHDLLVTTLTLGPLTLEETWHLLEAIGIKQEMNTNPAGRFIDIGQWLFHETDGQPFYLVEILKDLIARQILSCQATPQGKVVAVDQASLSTLQHQGPLPPGVRRLILSHLERLTTMGRALLTASALLGQAAPFALLCRLAEVEEHEALPALEEVLRQGLLREVSAKPGREPSYLFGHDKIREVVIAELGETQRRFLHRRALAVLEALAWPAAGLAYHAQAAGLAEQTMRFSLVAGDEAVRVSANAEASLHYIQALEALSQIPETVNTQRMRLETLLKLVQVSWMIVDIERTLERLAEAERLARGLLDQRQLVHIHYWIGVVYGTRRSMRQARAYIEGVLVEARALGDEELVALASLQLSRVQVLQGQYSPVEPLLTPIIPILERLGKWLDWTYALGYLGVALAARGQCREAVAQGQRSVEHAGNTEEMRSYRSLQARHFLSIIYLYSGDPSSMLKAND